MISCARRWRPLLKKPLFIGVTGSAGKSTTKELLLGMLSHKGQAVGNEGSYSNIDKQAEALLRLAPIHSFFVTELSGHRPGEMDDNLPLVRPSIGIVTVVRDDHSSNGYPREAIAEEKGKLIASLPASGTAVLNADDELVLAMAARSAARVITYGLSPNAELRAEDISSVWPERLQMTLVRGSERIKPVSYTHLRKIIVIGELQDIASQKGAKFAKTAILAQEIADITIFVGPWASSVLKARKPGAGDTLRTFSHVRDASEYINSISREGDLILLKGANRQDHLLRIILARNGDVACWRDDCNRFSFCNECPDRNKPSGLPVLMASATVPDAANLAPPSGLCPIEHNEQVIVGLGNPESRYAGTPHNVGYEAVERLATSWGLTWEITPEVCIARGSVNGTRISLVKIQTAMNLIGSGLKQLSESVAFSPEQCILVFDDLDLPLVAQPEAEYRVETNDGDDGNGVILTESPDEPRKFYIDGGEVEIIGHLVYDLDTDGKKLQVVRYTEYSGRTIRSLYPERADLQSAWTHPDTRSEVLRELTERGISFEELAVSANQPDACLLYTSRCV